METDFSSLLALSEDMASALRLIQLDEIEEAAQEQSADEARQALRWLSNLPSAEMPMDEWLDAGTPEEALAKAVNLSQLVRSFICKVRRARAKRPDILRAEAMVENAYHAAAAMTQAVIEYTLSKLPRDHAKAALLEASLSALPPQAAMRRAQSVNRLAETLAAGMERASGKNMRGTSAPERLAEISKRLSATARSLRPIETLEPPAREESIELAREILRRLKNLGFSDKPLKELIEAGTPEDKAAFAEAVDEAADMVKNLVLEAAEIDPEILQDQSVREAGEAVSSFMHGVKLMAAKEMPNSIAAAQQIAADVTQSPEEWDRLHHHTVNRLVKSMEGALEKAVGDIENDQEQQRQEDEQAQEAQEAALQQADSSKRKRKRRRRGPRSGSGGKKQQKDKAALEADDYVLKQGRFGRDAERTRIGAPAIVVPALNAEALAMVRQLGGALLNLGNQAKELKSTPAAAAPADKIVPSPGEKTIAQRIIEEQQKPQKNPKNQSRPGV